VFNENQFGAFFHSSEIIELTFWQIFMAGYASQGKAQ
jgi:hypothetical protein